MQAFELVLILMAATAALGVVSARLAIPPPVLLVIGGVALAFIPVPASVRLDPDTVFLLFVPPLLYRAAIHTSLYEFRRGIGGIAFLSIMMVLATMTVVAAVAHAVVPNFSWAAAFVLGAIVSPPDSVAAIAFTRRLRLPRSVITLLLGEGLVNDASALVAYRTAVAAMVTGAFSLQKAGLVFVSAALIGVATGLAAGWAIARLRERLRDVPVVENTVSLLTPFAAFIPADRLGGSAILAVVAAGLYLNRWGPRRISPATRLQANAMWDMIVFLLEGLIFVLVGFELPRVFATLSTYDAAALALWGAAVAAAVIVSRIVLMVPGAQFGSVLRRWRGVPESAPVWSHVLLVGWAGIRGGDSLVIALSLPLLTAAGAPLPARDLIIFLTIVVIVTTLLVQGLSLEALIRKLRIRDEDADDLEEAKARERLREAGSACIADRERSGLLSVDLARRERTLFQFDGPQAPTLELRSAVLAVQRRELLALYDEGAIGEPVMQRLLRELDLQAALLT